MEIESRNRVGLTHAEEFALPLTLVRACGNSVVDAWEGVSCEGKFKEKAWVKWFLVVQEVDEMPNSNADGSIPDDHECAKG